MRDKDFAAGKTMRETAWQVDAWQVDGWQVDGWPPGAVNDLERDFDAPVAAALVVDLDDSGGARAPRRSQMRAAAGLPVESDDLDDFDLDTPDTNENAGKK